MSHPRLLGRLIETVPSATDDLLVTVRRLSDDDVRRPSALPGWSVGHVLTHLARNADAVTNLTNWARTSVPTPAYSSPESRNADIEAGAARPVSAHLADLAGGTAKFLQAVAEVPDANWETEVTWPSGTSRPAWMILPARLTEIEVHHVDLGLGRTFAAVDPWLRDVLLDYAMTNRPGELGFGLRADDTGWARDEPGARIVSGDSAALLGWLLGRADGTDLTYDGELPSLPAWG